MTLLQDDPIRDTDGYDGGGFDALPPLTDPEAHALIRRLARIEDERAALKANYEALTRDLDARKEHLLATEGERLREWTAANLRGQKRSVRTLHGVAGFRTNPARLLIENEMLAIEWARERAPYAVSERLDSRRLGSPEQFSAVNPETGEVVYAPPPGVQVAPAEDRFYVKSGARAGADTDE